jgi:hypothetical protein
MVTTTTITITQNGTFAYQHESNRRLTEDEVHDIVVNDGLIGLDPAKCDVQVFFQTKES